MTPIEYQQLALRTSGGTRTPLQHRLAIAALGLCGESAEFCVDEIAGSTAKEAGDILWYIAEICDALNIGFEDLIESAKPSVREGLGKYMLIINACQFADHAKKIAGHGHEVDKHIEAMKTHLQEVLVYLLSVLSEVGLNLEEVMIINIVKLKKRYPEGFSVEASKGRTE